MNHYEILAIVKGTLADTEIPSVITKIEETLKKHECTLHYTQNLEKRRLAYPIQHQQYGSYVLIEFDCIPTNIQKLEHEFRLNQELLRHVIVKRNTVGKPRPLFRESETTAEKRPLRKELKIVTLDEALQTVEKETQNAQKIHVSSQEPVSHTTQENREKPTSKKDQQPSQELLTDEDIEKKLDDKLEEIFREGI